MWFRKDLSYTLRSLRKAPGFSLIVIFTLALGIGANTAVFSLIHVLLLRPLPYPDSSHLLMLFETKTPNDAATGGVIGGRRSGVAPANFLDWQAQSRAFTGMAGTGGFHYNLTGSGAPEHVWGGAVSSSWFSLLGVTPALGRDFRPEEDAPAGTPVVILSDRLWRRRYQADTEIVGKTVGLNGGSFTVIGVMPPKADFRDEIELWVPLQRQVRPDRMLWRDSRWLDVIARPKPGVTLAKASDDLNRIAAGIRATHPTGDIYGAAAVLPLHEDLTSDVRGMLLVSFFTVGLVLLVACANVATLMLLRTTGREREIAIRMALGARTGTLLQQLIMEGVCLGAAAGVVGLVLGMGGKKLLLTQLSWESPELNTMDLSWPVLFFAFAISLTVGVIFALLPAIAILRKEKHDVQRRASFGTTANARGRRLRQAFVVSEIACSLVLTAGAGLLLRSLQALHHVSLGFDTDHRVIVLISLPRIRYQRDLDVVRFFQQVGDKVRALPGVEDATMSYGLPLTIEYGANFRTVQGNNLSEQFQPVVLRLADSHLLATLAVPLLRGRNIADGDRNDSEPVCVIDQEMAQRYFRNQEPVGQLLELTRLDVNGERRPRRIVGVVANVRNRVNEEPPPTVYVPYTQESFFSMQLLIHGRGSPAAVGQQVADVLRTVDPDQPVRAVSNYDSFLPDALADWRIAITLLAALAALAVGLTSLGVFAVLSCTVREKTREIGIRMAVGATPHSIRNLVLGQTAWLAAAGVAIGTGIAAACTRLLGSLIYGVRPTDPPTFVFAAVTLGIVALLAGYVPAKRAMKVDPILALRDE